MKGGHWIPISKWFKSALPHDREYTELEAAYSLQLDFDDNSKVTVAGYSDLWRWSRGKVYRFLQRMNIGIEYPENTSKKQNQNGQITVQITDRSRTDNGQIRLIENSYLRKEKNRSRTDNGQITDRSQNTTIEDTLNLNPKKKEKIYKKEKYLEFILLTKAEYEKLLKEFGVEKLKSWIERINNYIGSTGKKYKSHYHTILAWNRNDKKKQEEIGNVFKSGKIDYSNIRGRDG